MSKHLILVGACYIDTLLSVPFFPSEDSKLRATSSSTRLGGNCPNSIQVLQQLLTRSDDLTIHLISCLPSRSSGATQRIIESLTGGHHDHGSDAQEIRRSAADLEHCIYREDHIEPASSYIVRSGETGSRTIINYNNLPEMTVAEFEERAQAFDPTHETWWHFEGRIPAVTLQCMHTLRTLHPGARISVEVEKPGRDGLPELAEEADVVFFSRAWAESRGHNTPEACLRGESTPKACLSLCTWGADGAAVMSHPSNECDRCPVKQRVTVVDAVGAGDTFIAGMLYSLVCHNEDWDTGEKVRLAVDLATCKVQLEGFNGLGAAVVRPVSRNVSRQILPMRYRGDTC